jgi:hypothetical protein
MLLNLAAAKLVHATLLFLRVQRRAGRYEATYPRDTPERGKDEPNKFRIPSTAEKVSKISTWVLRFGLSSFEFSWGLVLNYLAYRKYRRALNEECMSAGRTVVIM